MKTMIYKPGTMKVIWGIPCDFQVVDSEEADKLKAKRGKNKWYSCPKDFPEVKDDRDDE